MKNTYTNKPLWTSINKVPYTYPWLSHDENTQICILGGGLTGALCCFKSMSFGIDTVLISADPIASSLTAQSYGIMQLHVNKGLYILSKKIGISNAIKIYNLIKNSIDEIEDLCSSLPSSCGFKRGNSLLFTQDKSKNEFIQKEYMLLKHNGFDVNFITKEDALERFPFNIESGILYNNLAATVDPYMLTHEIIKKCEESGASIYENSRVDVVGSNHAIPYLKTNLGKKINANNIIFTTGKSMNKLLRDIGIKRTSFAVATKPVENTSRWTDNICLLNCIDTPKMNFALTKDDRILSYGLDAGMTKPFRNLTGLFSDSSCINRFENKKFDSLSEGLSYYFPRLCNTSPEYAFATDYIQTEQGLPIIGELENLKNCLYCLCPGDNGIVFSDIVSDMLLKFYKSDAPFLNNFIDVLENTLVDNH